MVMVFGSMYPMQTFFSWWPWREGHTCSHSEHRSQDSQRRWYCLTWGRESSTLPGIFYRSDLRKQVGSFFVPVGVQSIARRRSRSAGERFRQLVEAALNELLKAGSVWLLPSQEMQDGQGAQVADTIYCFHRDARLWRVSCSRSRRAWQIGISLSDGIARRIDA